MVAALLGASVLSSFAGSGDGLARTLWLRLDPVASTAFHSVGKDFADSLSFDKKTQTLKMHLKPGLSVAQVVNHLSRRREVLEIRAADGVRFTHEKDLRSVSSLSEFIEKLGGEDDERLPAKHESPKGEAEEEKAGTEYLRALRDYLRVRAYPFDRLDSSAYDRAIAQAVRMKPAQLGWVKPNALAAGAPGISGKWKFVGPFDLNTPYRTYYGLRPSSGRVNAIAYDPVDPTIIYVGAPQGGVMKSTDGGKTWTAIGDNWGFNTVSAIAIDPKNSKTIYVGTGDFQGLVPAYTMGIMKTTDGGATWTNIGRSSFGSAAVSAIAIDPTNSANIIVTTGRGPDGTGRVWRSTNAGQAWSASINVLASWTSVSFAAPDSAGKRALYAAGSGGNLYRSADNGGTWTKLTSPSPANDFYLPHVVGSAVDSKTAYLLSTSNQKIYKTTDSGATWTDTTGTFPGDYNWSQGFYDWYIACYKDGSKDHLFVGLIDVVESPDGGSTWKAVGETYTQGAKTHNDQHSFAANPSNPNEVLIGNDGGLYKATGGSGNWTITGLSANLGITQFYNVVWHPSDKTRILGGTQDNASPVSMGNLARWENVGGGDGGFNAINPANPNIQYCTIYGFTVVMTNDGWKTSRDISPDAGGDVSPFVTPIYQDPVNTRYLYGCTNYLWRYDVQTNTWTPRMGGAPLSNGSLIHVVAVAPSDGNVIYTGSDDGRLFVSTNAGAAWRNLNTASLPNRAITSISVSPTNPKQILVGLSGTGTQHLFLCADTSATTPTFAPKNGSGTSMLPDVPLNAIERDPKKPDLVWYAGTDIGVFSTGDGGTTWTNATVPLGLPNVQVNSLNANAKTGLLSAGTYGRGIWSITLGEGSGDAGGLLAPTAYGIMTGSRASGDLKSLAADDGNNLVVNSTNVSGLGQVSAATATFSVPGTTGNLISLNLEVSLSSSNVAATQQIYVKNWKTGAYDLLKAMSGTTARTTQKITVGGTIANYMSSTRKVEIVVRGLVPSKYGTATYRLNIDRASADATSGG
jgi:photosystem II stability/assembly factor-like uncharacterized protein